MSDLPNYKPALAMPELLAAYRGYLQQRGYKAGSINAYAHAVEHFTGWLAGESVELGEADKAVARFLNDHLPVCDCPGPLQRHKITIEARSPIYFASCGRKA